MTEVGKFQKTTERFDDETVIVLKVLSGKQAP
jgi:hypothetical protein